MIKSFRERTSFSLLAIGGVVHLIYSLTLLILGNFKIFPAQILEGGVLINDPVLYVRKCVELSERLFDGNWQFLIERNEQIHLRLYALSYSALSPLFGDGVLSFELVNLPLFLVTLHLVYKIGETCFDGSTGFRSGLALLLFPSLLIHYSQPIRDPLFISVFLLFFWLLAKVLKEPFRLSKAIPVFAALFATFFFMWLVRDSMFFIYLGVVAIALCLFAVKAIKQPGKAKYNFLILSGLLMACLLTPKYFSYWIPDKELTPKSTPEDVLRYRAYAEKVERYKTSLREKQVPNFLVNLSSSRNNFLLLYRGAGTNIDPEVSFQSIPELLRYFPRAIGIGWFSPFPDMWLSEGRNVGKAGRIVSGFEMIIIYFFTFLAAAAIVKRRHSVFTWQLFFTVILASLALGLVVVNLGALYRMRYAFWCLLIILGTEGMRLLLNTPRKPVPSDVDGENLGPEPSLPELAKI